MDALTDGYLESSVVAALFDARATLSRMLEFEAALASSAADLGIIPAQALPAIVAACDVDLFDLDVIRRGTAAGATPAIPMVTALTALVAASDGEAARWVHWGSTSQDVMDTALMLQARAALAHMDGELAHLAARLAELVANHRDTLMVARTLSQHALPTTFALKAAGWLDGLLAVRAQLARSNAQLPLQCGGAAGTLAALGEHGLALRDALAARLELRAVVPWHTERSVVRDLAAALGQLAASGGKIACDLILLMQSEVGEVGEAASPGRGGSTAMPNKRNPVAAIGAYAGARRAPGLLATVFGSFEHMHERAAGAWHAETAALRELFTTAAAVLEQLVIAFDGLEVDTARMRATLDASAGLVMAEAVMSALAPQLGRPAAQALVSAAARGAAAGAGSFADLLAAQPEVMAALGTDGLRAALAPAAYLGAADAFIDAILARHAAG